MTRSRVFHRFVATSAFAVTFGASVVACFDTIDTSKIGIDAAPPPVEGQTFEAGPPDAISDDANLDADGGDAGDPSVLFADDFEGWIDGGTGPWTRSLGDGVIANMIEDGGSRVGRSSGSAKVSARLGVTITVPDEAAGIECRLRFFNGGASFSGAQDMQVVDLTSTAGGVRPLLGGRVFLPSGGNERSVSMINAVGWHTVLVRVERGDAGQARIRAGFDGVDIDVVDDWAWAPLTLEIGGRRTGATDASVTWDFRYDDVVCRKL